MKIILITILSFSFSAFAQKSAPIASPPSARPSYDGPAQPIAKPVPQPTPPVRPEPEPEIYQPPQTTYQDVVSWYKSGRDVKWADIKGSYSGACVQTPMFYRATSHSVFLTYLGDSKSNPDFLINIPMNSYGPYATPNYTSEFIDYMMAYVRAQRSYYDKYMPSRIMSGPTFSVKNTDLTKEDFDIDSYRLYNNTLVSISKAVRTASVWIPGTTMNNTVYPDQVWKACYYTKKITD